MRGAPGAMPCPMAVGALAKQGWRSFVVRNRPRRPRTAIAPLVFGLGVTALPKYIAEPRRRREKYAGRVPWLPGWHKTRALSSPMCHPLIPRNSIVVSATFQGGFMSLLRVALSARLSPYENLSRQRTIAAQVALPSMRPRTPRCARSSCPRRLGTANGRASSRRSRLVCQAPSSPLPALLPGVWRWLSTRDAQGESGGSRARPRVENAESRAVVAPAVAYPRPQRFGQRPAD